MGKSIEGKKMPSFFCTMVPGLECVAEEEIREKMPGADIIRQERGKVFFAGNVEKKALFSLTCADNVYCYVTELKIGPHKKDLEAFRKSVKNVSFQRTEAYLGLSGALRILVSASKKGKQTYSRYDVAEIATRALTEGIRYRAGTVEAHDLAVRLDVDGTRCGVAVQLTSAAFKFRGENYEFMPGGIRPTVAAALVRVSKPTTDEVFYDPFCGSGSVVKERARYGARRILASDISEAAVEVAKRNAPETVRVFCCDATVMKATDNSVDVIVSNIPWGKQIVVEDIGALYRAFLREADRVLAKNGRMILLTDREELEAMASEVGFLVEKLYTVSLHGVLASVYKLSRV